MKGCVLVPLSRVHGVCPGYFVQGERCAFITQFGVKGLRRRYSVKGEVGVAYVHL